MAGDPKPQKKCTMCNGTGVVKTPGQTQGVTCPRCGGTGVEPSSNVRGQL